MAKHGGKRPGAGRPPKADEVAMIESMDATKAPIEVWQKLASKVEDGDTQAIKCWLSYRYGKPSETVSLQHSGDISFENIERRIVDPTDE